MVNRRGELRVGEGENGGGGGVAALSLCAVHLTAYSLHDIYRRTARGTCRKIYEMYNIPEGSILQ